MTSFTFDTIIDTLGAGLDGRLILPADADYEAARWVAAQGYQVT